MPEELISKEEFMRRLHERCRALQEERAQDPRKWEAEHPGVRSTQVLALAELLYDLATEDEGTPP